MYLSLGSNAGDRRHNIEGALKELAHTEGVGVKAVSMLYLAAPVDMPDGTEPFLNCVAEISCTLDPLALLDRLEAIEQKMGRAGKGQNAPRTIDLDILLFGGRTIGSARLTIPHPRMERRRFALEPLAEIAPDVIHPVLGVAVSRLLEKVRDQEVASTGERPALPLSINHV
ncbi:MAG: 2-amino-4-hydroxy-6-hydroxymethyldihydropteridine diphosphokinase [Nitrospinae bacterium]|nr:2-amino-4-hydroxy-6-hydroxymethyldihydropteridine diphosphokinase [Nitrospinota bacterium]